MQFSIICPTTFENFFIEFQDEPGKMLTVEQNAVHRTPCQKKNPKSLLIVIRAIFFQLMHLFGPKMYF